MSDNAYLWSRILDAELSVCKLPRNEDGSCEACEKRASTVAALFVDTGWSCHPTPNGFMRFHDKNSVHVDGCQRLYVLNQQ